MAGEEDSKSAEAPKKRYCVVCEDTLTEKDLEDLCGDCFRAAKNPAPKILQLPETTLFMLGAGRALVDLGTAFLFGRTTPLAKSGPGSENDLSRETLAQIQETLKRWKKQTEADDEAFDAWCDRLGIPR